MKNKLLLFCSLFLFNPLYSQDWIPLFNGENLDGWEHVDKGNFIIENGILKTQGGMGLLYYKEQAFENAVIKVVYKNPEGKNAGVFIRIPERPTEAWMPVNKGYEVQIDDQGDEHHRTGVLYSFTEAMATPSKPGEWNTMEITLDGNQTKVSVNGELVTQFTEGQKVPSKKIWYEPDRGSRPNKGYIGLQNHGAADIVYFKEISYRPLQTKAVDKFWAHRFALRQDISYGDDDQQRLDIYVQGNYIGEPTFFKNNDAPTPTLIYFHGGGWTGGTKEGEQGFIMPYIQKGWNVVNVEYRTGKKTAPNAAEDVLSAMKWVAENAEKFNIDKNNIVISGASAGGHLCLLAGLINSIPDSHPSYIGNQIKIRGIVNWFGISDIEKVANYLSAFNPDWNYAMDWIGDKAELATISKKYSPINYVTKNAPPILSIHGSDDAIVPHTQAELLHDALEKVGAKHQLMTLPGGKHMGFTEAQFQMIYSTIFEFLDK